jgi:prolyl-tRNA synthetase
LDENGGFVLTGWCGDQQCECMIKEETGADIRAIPFEGQEMSKHTICIYCHKQAMKIALIARAY